MNLDLRRQFVRTSFGYFLEMLVRPTQAVERILKERPGFLSLIIFLTGISLLRGLLDGVLTLLTEGQLLGMWHAGRLLPWFILKAYPLLLADWLAGYVRWLGFALVPYLLGRFCGGRGRLVDFLRLYGVILGIYVITVLPNFAYFFVPLPMIRFHAAPQFSPTLGVGQILTSAWLVWVSYLVLKRVHGLPAFESFAIGFLTPALNIAALVLPGAILFNLPQLQAWGGKQLTYVTLLGFSAASVLLIMGFVILAWQLRKAEVRRLTMEASLNQGR
jgi:hypothetical protein